MPKFESVTMYKTGDGKVFKTAKEAEAHHLDLICEMFDNIIKPLDLSIGFKHSDIDKIVLAMYAQREHISQYIAQMEIYD